MKTINIIFLAIACILFGCKATSGIYYKIIKGQNEFTFSKDSSTITGTIIELNTKSNLRNVQIQFKNINLNNSIAMQSDENGKFKLKVLSGRYQLSFFYVGDRAITKDITLKSNENIIMKVLLEWQIGEQ